MEKKTKATTAVVVRGAQSQDHKTPEQRVEAVRGYLDKMEVVQLQHATGAILIGMELLALKDQLGHGSFSDVFEKQIARPRFSYRSASRYMCDANRVRRKMLKDGGITLMGVLNIAPSALPMARQRELQAVIAEAVGDRNLSGLRGALGSDAPKQITDGKSALTGQVAEREAHAKVWADLCRKITHEALGCKSWKWLAPDALKHARNCLQSAFEAMPK
jgi:hypothetical protein